MQKDGADLDLFNILWCKMKTVIVYFGTKLVFISRVIVTTNSNELEYEHQVTITDSPQTLGQAR